MLTYEKLMLKPRQFQSFTVIRTEEFQKMLENAEGSYQRFEQKRLGTRKRQRKIGAGRPSTLRSPNCELGGGRSVSPIDAARVAIINYQIRGLAD